ncbi:peptidase C14A [Mactra antiquata]
MDRRQKSTLRGQHIRIADELILDEDFYAALRRDKIFTHSMIDIIKAEQKPRDRVYKMLELLEKRGPKAFDNFTNILRENYDWLAEVLEEEYNKRLQQDIQVPMQQQVPMKYEVESYKSNHKMKSEGNQRAVSTPNSKRRNVRQTGIQATMSASLVDKESQQFFSVNPHSYNQPRIPHDMFDSLDNVSISLPVSNDDTEKPKKYKDACMSPINVLESARKTVNTTTSPTIPEKDNLGDEIDGARPVAIADTDDKPTQTNYERKSSDERDSAFSLNDDSESQSTDITNVSSSGFPITEGGDQIDGPKDLDTESAMNEDGFPSSEIYYECVRRGSSCMPLETLGIRDNDTDETGTEISDDQMHYTDIPYEQSESYQANQDSMRSLFIKLVEAECDTADPDEDFIDEVSWEMINEVADKLISRLQNSDDMKMIRRCYGLFPEKERRHALNICIQSLQEGKKEVENQLRTKQKEIEEMVYDLWKHQQDISNIKRLRKSVVDLEMENKNMKSSLENLSKDFEVQMKSVDEKDAKILELETKLKDFEIRRAGNNQRRGSQTQRQRTIPGQSPRRQNSQYPLDPPRLTVLQSAYGTGSQSPRPQNANGRRPAMGRR